jgi:hypothetical protein
VSTYLRVLIVIIPEHRAALGTETSFGSAHLGWLAVLVECQRSDVDSNESAFEAEPAGITDQAWARDVTYLILSLPRVILRVSLFVSWTTDRLNSSTCFWPMILILPIYPPTLRQMEHWHSWYGTGV